jgi:hypothetical protein
VPVKISITECSMFFPYLNHCWQKRKWYSDNDYVDVVWRKNFFRALRIRSNHKNIKLDEIKK